MLRVLDTYNAENVKSDVLGEKLKVTFTIRDQQQALKCFQDFVKTPYLNRDQNRTKIFYLKPGIHTVFNL